MIYHDARLLREAVVTRAGEALPNYLDRNLSALPRALG